MVRAGNLLAPISGIAFRRPTRPCQEASPPDGDRFRTPVAQVPRAGRCGSRGAMGSFVSFRGALPPGPQSVFDQPQKSIREHHRRRSLHYYDCSSLAFEADSAERTASCDLGHRGQLVELQEL